MEDVAPILKVVFEIEISLQSGDSIRNVAKRTDIRSCEFSKRFVQWVNRFEQTGVSTIDVRRSRFERAFFRLMADSMEGRSIAAELAALKEEIVLESTAQITAFIETLPYKLMIPVLLLLFPALMMIVLGPVIQKIIGMEV